MKLDQLLKNTEPHPSYKYALAYIENMPEKTLLTYLEAYKICAKYKRESQICGTTLQKLISGEPVDDRHLMGLAWNLMSLEEKIWEVSTKPDILLN